MKQARVLAAGLSLSAAAFIGLVVEEHYTERAVIPTKNDRPTVGHGSTFWEDGRPVKMGETITPVRAVQLAGHHISKEEQRFRASIPGVKLQPGEYDLYVKWTYQYGTGAWSKSSMRGNLLAGNYAGACKALLAYKFSGGYDCTTMVNGKPNKVCYGVWTRNLDRYTTCMEMQ